MGDEVGDENCRKGDALEKEGEFTIVCDGR